jgi:hypothetical protein
LWRNASKDLRMEPVSTEDCVSHCDGVTEDGGPLLAAHRGPMLTAQRTVTHCPMVHKSNSKNNNSDKTIMRQ